MSLMASWIIINKTLVHVMVMVIKYAWVWEETVCLESFKPSSMIMTEYGLMIEIIWHFK